ncbi:unnamed protein product [Rodentolepis nana]|uniref:Bestrophin homolog n=1 Tax=Rodentolepis nana TaxID=102285 RepID=A0A0R3TBF5_RODNA|nr:unnamed protein product [Rodentolepis nana]
MEVDDSEGEELSYYIDKCQLTNHPKSPKSVLNCLIGSAANFVLDFYWFRSIVSPIDEDFMNPPQHRGNESLSPRRVIPIEVVERDYEAHVRRHSVSPSRKS